MDTNILIEWCRTHREGREGLAEVIGCVPPGSKILHDIAVLKEIEGRLAEQMWREAQSADGMKWTATHIGGGTMTFRGVPAEHPGGDTTIFRFGAES